MKVIPLSPVDARYPAQLPERLGDDAPAQLYALGNLELLALPKTALFCSARCPGRVILAAYDQAARMRDAERCIISGFHSPVEKECLRILLRGSSPVIICPARGLPKRLPPEWQKPLSSGRMLVLSIFSIRMTRVVASLAADRNEFAAAMADDVWFVHITPGGQLERLSDRIASWGMHTARCTEESKGRPNE